jgi:predicted nucleic acid-binding protein
MTDLLFVDTNVLIYSLDPSDPEKRNKAIAFLAAGTQRRALVTSIQTLNECYRVLIERRHLLPVQTSRGFVSALAPTCTAPLDQRTTALAWQIEDQTNYSWWDCVMLASAVQANCRAFVTEDLDDGRTIEGMLIMDPFRNDIGAILPVN